MSFNQSRAEKTDSAQFKKSGRSGNSGHQWNYSNVKGGGGGGGGTGTGHPPSSVNPSYSNNRSYNKKSNNAQGAQPRAGTGSVNLESENRSLVRPLQNGAHPVPTLQGTANAPIGGGGGGVPTKSTAETLSQTNTGGVTNAQLPQSVPRKSEAPAPNTPAKATGDASRGFPLQFGSISPGFVNIPARTSSAPPNLDEQKHDQARHAVRPGMNYPVPSVPKPQQTPRKAVTNVNQSNIDDSHQYPKAKRGVQVSATPPMPQPQKATTVHPMSGVPMPMAYHQPQVAVQFGGPSSLIQSQPPMPMQMPMQMQMGNPPQLQQQVFLQPHPMAHQGLMHQGQGLNFTPQMNPQLAPQLGNLGIGMGSHFSPQQAGKFGGHRKPVKITHPDTREELRLDESLGPKSHSNTPQTLPTTTSVMPVHSVNYYHPGSYPSGPLTNNQINPGSQLPRFGYPILQGTQSVAFTNPHSHKNSHQMHGITEQSVFDHSRDVQNILSSAPSASPQVTVSRPSGVLLHAVKVEAPTTFVEKAGFPKFSQQASEANSIHSQREVVAHPESSLLLPKPGLDMKLSSLPGTVKQQTKGTSSISIQEPASAAVSDECRIAEVVNRSDPPKNLQNEQSKGGPPSTHQVSTQSTSMSDLSSQTSLQIDSIDNHVSEETDVKQVNASTSTSSSEPQKLLNTDIKEQTVVGMKEESKPDDRKISDISPDLVSPSEVASQSEHQNAKNIAAKTSEVEIQEPEEKSEKHINDKLEISSSGLANTDGDSSSDILSTNDETSLSDATPTLTKPLSLSAEIPLVSSTTPVSEPSLKPVAELTRTKSMISKNKKKRKEYLLRADAGGASSDLYNAYKKTEEKKDTTAASDNLESMPSDPNEVVADDPQTDIISSERSGNSKFEPDDWEDAADISTPKLEGEVDSKHADDDTITGKKYSRDFLLTLSEHHTDLPKGFKISPEISEAVMCLNVNNSREQYPNFREPYRSDGRVGGMGEDDKWRLPSPGVSGRNPRMDNYNNRPGQGGNYGVLNNPRSPAGPYGGAIQTGPIRNNADSDRWQRSSSFQKGLIPSPQTPMQVMHKAEKRYEINKISDEEQGKQRRLKAILNKLTPQNFDKLFQQVKDVNIDNGNTLDGVIAQIFDKALMEPTFCEMYANFCSHLAAELPDFNEDNEKITFKRLLLNKCQEEFERGEREQEEADKADEEGVEKLSDEEREEKRLKARRRMLGNIRLIGELYKKKMLTEKIMHACIKKLLGQYQNPDEEDIECLCKLMSTIGEMIDHQKAKEHIDAYFDMMGNLSNNMKLSSRVRFMLKDSIDLRKNKWQERRKVEGPKKIDEVHRDAAQERQVQASRLSSRGPNINPNSVRARQTTDFGQRGQPPPMMSPNNQMGGFRGPPQRGYVNLDIRRDERQQYENRTLTTLPQRPMGENSITLGPQGGLARGMASSRGQNNIPSTDMPNVGGGGGGHRRVVGGDLNGYNHPTQDRIHVPTYDQNINHGGNRDFLGMDRGATRPLQEHGQGSSSLPNVHSEKRLQDMSIAAIKEFYSAKDLNEVVQCIKDLNAPSFHPNMISIWVTDSFERKDGERDLLSKLIIDLARLQERVLIQEDLLNGFDEVLLSLEESVNDAPKAAEFLGRLMGKMVIENLVSLSDMGQLVLKGGEVPGRLVEIGLAAEVVATVMETIDSLKGEAVLNDIRTRSNLKLENFLSRDPKKSHRLNKFI
ncbi:eukaryotic translation initiation factor 4G [Impatiens glandulifera]|uniref:eukaryotic translation initiation factor 4G n=1 Tax=Impatiens glandulifera TaxID=253017 RepID=UPI001FB0A20B|nr:eukaryotic translation initiation factor 4G [Impatiens glandulifera]